jgi:hypothetical protein
MITFKLAVTTNDQRATKQNNVSTNAPIKQGERDSGKRNEEKSEKPA